MARATDRLLRRRCHELLSQLTLPDPWDLDQFIALVARVRGRRIVIEPAPAHILRALGRADQTSGMTRAELGYDLILVPADATAERTLVIVLHELAHLLFGHLVNPARAAGPAGPADRVVVSSGEVHAAALARSSWAAPWEREAELLATMVWTYSGDHRTTGGPASEVVARAALVFGLTR